MCPLAPQVLHLLSLRATRHQRTPAHERDALDNQDALFDATESSNPPRVLTLRVRNYRALKSVDLLNLTPLTVLLGPNGSGKSTVFDVWDFLSECFLYGLRHAWDRRGRASEIRTRGEPGPVSIDIRYQERPDEPVITYHLAIDEGVHGPEVVSERMQWRRGSRGRPFRFLDMKSGIGEAAADETSEREPVHLRARDMIAAGSLGQFEAHPRVAALREFIRRFA